MMLLPQLTLPIQALQRCYYHTRFCLLVGDNDASAIAVAYSCCQTAATAVSVMSAPLASLAAFTAACLPAVASGTYCWCCVAVAACLPTAAAKATCQSNSASNIEENHYSPS